jgi:hypothetical protein
MQTFTSLILIFMVITQTLASQINNENTMSQYYDRVSSQEKHRLAFFHFHQLIFH